MTSMIYGRAETVKFFDAPEPRRAVQDASESFSRVWIRVRMEALRRRISGHPRDCGPWGRYSRGGAHTGYAQG